MTGFLVHIGGAKRTQVVHQIGAWPKHRPKLLAHVLHLLLSKTCDRNAHRVTAGVNTDFLLKATLHFDKENKKNGSVQSLELVEAPKPGR
jgi:hypothetical protein